MTFPPTESSIWIGHRYLDLLKPSFEEHELAGLIFPTLARLPRYNVVGANETWTVGQHLLLGMCLYRFASKDRLHNPGEDTPEVERTLKWGWLAHDAAEAFIGDKTLPLKRAERTLHQPKNRAPLPFDEIENRIHAAIAEHWLLPHLGSAGEAIRDRIHYLDMLTARVEKYYIVASLSLSLSLSLSGEWPGLPDLPWGENSEPGVLLDRDFHEILHMDPRRVTRRLVEKSRMLKMSSRRESS